MIGMVARSGDPEPRQKAGLFIVISGSAWVGSLPVLWPASTMASYSRHKALDFAQVFHRISRKLE